jgi:hypothetical protein
MKANNPKTRPMTSLLNLDQTTLANMTAALEYVYRKLPSDRDNLAVRKDIGEAIIAAANAGQTSLGALTNVGLKIVNSYLFPPSRTWLRAFGYSAASIGGPFQE